MFNFYMVFWGRIKIDGFARLIRGSGSIYCNLALVNGFYLLTGRQAPLINYTGILSASLPLTSHLYLTVYFFSHNFMNIMSFSIILSIYYMLMPLRDKYCDN